MLRGDPLCVLERERESKCSFSANLDRCVEEQTVHQQRRAFSTSRKALQFPLLAAAKRKNSNGDQVRKGENGW